MNVCMVAALAINDTNNVATLYVGTVGVPFAIGAGALGARK